MAHSRGLAKLEHLDTRVLQVALMNPGLLLFRGVVRMLLKNEGYRWDKVTERRCDRLDA